MRFCSTPNSLPTHSLSNPRFLSHSSPSLSHTHFIKPSCEWISTPFISLNKHLTPPSPFPSLSPQQLNTSSPLPAFPPPPPAPPQTPSAATNGPRDIPPPFPPTACSNSPHTTSDSRPHSRMITISINAYGTDKKKPIIALATRTPFSDRNCVAKRRRKMATMEQRR